MRKQSIIGVVSVLLLVGSTGHSPAQSTMDTCDCPTQGRAGRGSLSFAWGYNRSFFTRTTLHFVDRTSDNYDFTLHDVRALDRPGFDIIGSSFDNLSIPQYVYRIAYMFNDKYDLGIELSFDHVKYVVEPGQTVRMTGHIRGTQFNQDVIIDDGFVHFEHTNGANYLMLNLLKRTNLVRSTNRLHWLSVLAKFGAGPVIPKSDVILFGRETDNKYHIAGYVIGLDVGLRYDFFKYGFLEVSAKGSSANYVDVLTVADGRADHRFFSLELIAALGFQVNL